MSTAHSSIMPPQVCAIDRTPQGAAAYDIPAGVEPAFLGGLLGALPDIIKTGKSIWDMF